MVVTVRWQTVHVSPLFILLLTSCAGLTYAVEPDGSEALARLDSPARGSEDVFVAHEDELLLDDHGIPLFKDPFTGPPGDVIGMPGEYEPVERVLLGWHGGNWAYVDYFARVLREITPDAPAVIAVEDAEDEVLLRDALADHGIDQSRIEMVIQDLDSMWIRDYGPLLVRTYTGFRVVDFPYHFDRQGDDRYPTLFAVREHLPLSRPALELEGGHIQSDGAGRCVVTDDVLSRNEGFLYEVSDVRRMLHEFLGCEQVTWVPPLFGEETGHVDVFAYVTAPGRILVGRYARGEDPVNQRRLDLAARILVDEGWEVTRIPMPRNDRRRVFRTYTNVLLTNHTVVVPIYRQDRRFEAQALAAYREAFPERRVVGVVADDVVSLAGAIHCTIVAVPELHPGAPFPATHPLPSTALVTPAPAPARPRG